MLERLEKRGCHEWGRGSVGIRHSYGVFTLSDTENENDSDNENDNYGFHYNMQNTSPRQIKTQILIEFCTLVISLVLSVAQCEYTISAQRTR